MSKVVVLVVGGLVWLWVAVMLGDKLQVSILWLTLSVLGGKLWAMNKAAQSLGRLGGLKRAANMTSEQRKVAARVAAVSRWTAKRQALPVPSVPVAVK